MSLQEHVYSVLIVSSSDVFNSSIKELLPVSKFSPVKIELSISKAKQTVLERSYDFILINSPLSDDTGIRFSVDLSDLKSTVVLLMVRGELYLPTYAKVAPHGVYTLSKPISRVMVSQAIDWMIATRERLKKFEKKTLSTEEKIQEIRIVNRAKWLLISELKMTEEIAHRYIEKQAMDRCVPKKEIAEEIIKLYS